MTNPRTLFFMFLMIGTVTGASVVVPETSVSVSSSNLEHELEIEKKPASSMGKIKKPRETNTLKNPSLEKDKVPWSDYPNNCESFTVIQGVRPIKNKRGEARYPFRYRRNRYRRTFSDQQRTRELIHLVAREMGANKAGQYLVDMIASHESSLNPEAIHILNRDLEANKGAWDKHTYSPEREKNLLTRMESKSAQSKEFWKLKAELSSIQMYKGNPYWNDRLKYTHQIPEHTRNGKSYPAESLDSTRSVWAFGYGLFGMNSVLYTHVWDPQAPPWVLCGDEGIIAIVTAVWALREQQSTCAYLSQKDPETYGTDGNSVRGIIRRWGRGQCGPGTPKGAWQKVMDSASKRLSKQNVKFTWSTVPDFGNKFSKYDTYVKKGRRLYRKDEEGKKIPSDRTSIIDHMRARAEEEGLLRPEPLERKKKGSAPKVISKRNNDKSNAI